MGKYTILVITIILSVSKVFAQVPLVSSFDTDAENWTADGGALYYQNQDGNPGGFIDFEDNQDGKGVFNAPAKFLGNLANYCNGTLSFDLKNTIDNGQDMLYGFGSVKITSALYVAEKNVVPLELLSQWTAFSINLSAEEWGFGEAGWDSLLADVTGVSIQIDAQWNYYDRAGMDNFSIIPNTTGINSGLLAGHSANFALFQNYPNPFYGFTTISWHQSEKLHVHLQVYDFMGREIKTLADTEMPPGKHKVTFDASGLPGGVYFCQLQAGKKIVTQKIILLKN